MLFVYKMHRLNRLIPALSYGHGSLRYCNKRHHSVFFSFGFACLLHMHMIFVCIYMEFFYVPVFCLCFLFRNVSSD